MYIILPSCFQTLSVSYAQCYATTVTVKFKYGGHNQNNFIDFKHSSTCSSLLLLLQMEVVQLFGRSFAL